VRRTLLVVAALLVAELVSIALAVKAFGALGTFAVIVVTSAVGAWLTRVEGVGALRRVREVAAAGRAPTRELADAALVVTAGLLLLFPGLLSDLVGIALALPPVRSTIVGWGLRRFRAPVGMSFGSADVRFRTTFGGPGSAPGRPPSWVRQDEVIDLDADEYYVDEPRGELGRGPGSER